MKVLKVGDMIWWAKCGTTQVKEKCIVCYGDLVVKVTLGNGDVVKIPCNYCSTRFETPRGYTTRYKYTSQVEYVKIERINRTETADGEKVKYHNSCYVLYDGVICETKEEAEKVCEEKIKQHELDEVTRAERIKKDQVKSYAWNAGYHLRNAKDHKRQAEYHDKMAIICKDRSKPPKKP